jgi:cytochrome c peroxidase
VEEVVAKLAQASYAAEFRQVFGADIFSRPQDAFDRAKVALQAMQQEDPAFAPFSSKYDEVLRGQATLTAAEQRGLVLFNSPAKGNCAACHPSAKAADGSHPLFTDFSYDALGVPRNRALKPVQDDASFYDLGLCAVAGFEGRTDLCGAFKVPTLRNVELTYPYFHDGEAVTLTQAVDTMGKLQLGRTFTAVENAQIVAFLKTLTGEQPKFALPILPPSTDATPRPQPF